MPITAFSIGRDSQVVIISSTGRVDLTHVTGFDSRQLTQSVRVTRIDGTHLGAELPRGWEGSFEVERGSASLEDFISALEQQYFSGGLPSPSSMYQYVTETDGSVSTYQFEGVVFRLANAGSWKGDASVKQKLEFFAVRRRRVS
jgi:hypothetical protein